MATHPDPLTFLDLQHHQCAEELAATHTGLGKLYRKLFKIERKLREKHELDIPCAKAKKLWWTRLVTTQSIDKLEVQKIDLLARLSYCRDAIAQHNASVVTMPPFWPGYIPQTPYLTPFVAYPSAPPTPWIMGPPFQPYLDQSPQYWDLSMLSEQSGDCADSGYHGSEMLSQISAHDQACNDETLSGYWSSAAGAKSDSCEVSMCFDGTQETSHVQSDSQANQSAIGST